jgi:hypothetical protein
MGVAECSFNKRKRPVQREEREQIALFDWARLQFMPAAPDIQPGAKIADYLYAIPNGGRRNPREAARLKQAGLKPGVSDICLPVARGGYNGLWIELKTGKNTLTPEQALWLRRMSHAGFLALMCRGWVNAKDAIEDYLEIA